MQDINISEAVHEKINEDIILTKIHKYFPAPAEQITHVNYKLMLEER